MLDESNLSRATLAKQLGLSTATITNLVSELLAQGVVVETGTVSNVNKKNIGRPQTSLSLEPTAKFALAIYIEVGQVQIAITNLFAKPIAIQSISHARHESSDIVLEKITEAAHDLLRSEQIQHQDIVGIGIGASGLVDIHSGENIVSPNLGWNNLQLREYFSKALHLPTNVDNNVRAMALGEAMFGGDNNSDVLAFIYGRVGVGAGFVIGKDVFRGAAGGAGEIGHTTMLIDNGKACTCGNYGCLETLVSESAIIESASTLDSSVTSLKETYQRARDGQAQFKTLIEKHARYLGVATANLVNILNPKTIVFGGIFGEGHDLWLPTIKEIIQHGHLLI